MVKSSWENQNVLQKKTKRSTKYYQRYNIPRACSISLIALNVFVHNHFELTCKTFQSKETIDTNGSTNDSQFSGVNPHSRSVSGSGETSPSGSRSSSCTVVLERVINFLGGRVNHARTSSLPRFAKKFHRAIYPESRFASSTVARVRRHVSKGTEEGLIHGERERERERKRMGCECTVTRFRGQNDNPSLNWRVGHLRFSSINWKVQSHFPRGANPKERGRGKPDAAIRRVFSIEFN